jgi:hypothetical protein
VVLAAGLWGVWHDRPTAREQTTIAEALPVADAAIGRVASAADGTDTVAAIGGYSQISRDCTVTAARSGQRFQRTLLLYTTRDNEGLLLDRIAARLPASYHATVRHIAPPGNALSADAGTFVAVHGVVLGPGVVRVDADTGCRPVSHPVSEPDSASTSPDRAPVEAVFARLGLRPTGWRTHRVPCPGEGSLWTVEATGGPGVPASLAVPLKDSAPAPVIARADLVAYRGGTGQVAASENGGMLTVTSTTGCGR